MAEFGHVGIISGSVCIDSWGVGPFVIDAGGKSFRFEDSDRFGPLLISKRGEQLKNPYPAERSPFWRAHRIWVRQGRRLEDGKVCIWDEPKPTLIKRFNRKTAVVVEAGEEDGAYIEVGGADHRSTP
jgi:hypothetical protein